MFNRSLYLIGTVLLLAFVCVGCSTEDVLSPPLADMSSDSTGELKSTTSESVIIYGNVYTWDYHYAVNQTVRIEWDYGAGWQLYDEVPVGGTYANFSITAYPSYGTKFRCSALGTTVERTWYGSAYLYFGIVQPVPTPGTKYDFAIP